MSRNGAAVDDGAVDLGLSEADRAATAACLATEARIRRSQLWKQIARELEEEQERIDAAGARDDLTIEMRAMLQVRGSFVRVLRLQLPRRVAEREHAMREPSEPDTVSDLDDDVAIRSVGIPDVM